MKPRISAVAVLAGLMALSARQGLAKEPYEVTAFGLPGLTATDLQEIVVTGFDDHGKLVGYDEYNHVGFAYFPASGVFKLTTPLGAAEHSSITALSSYDAAVGLEWTTDYYNGSTPVRWRTETGKTYAMKIPGFKNPKVVGINRYGDIVGCLLAGNEKNQCFVRVKNSVKPLEQGAIPIGIADSGLVAILGGFTYFKGVYTPVSVPGGGSSMLTSISADGHITGYFGPPDATQGFVQFGSTVTVIAVPGATSTVATAANSRGDVVGIWTKKDDSQQHGFVYRNGAYFGLHVLGSTKIYPTQINTLGTVAGTYQTFDSTDSVLGFVATCASGKNDCR